MDSADRIDPHVDGDNADTAAADTAARAAALRTRIRELGQIATDEPSPQEKPRRPLAKASDTRPSSTTEIEGNDFAGLARLVNRSSGARIPAIPAEQSAAPDRAIRLRWQYPSLQQISHATESDSDNERRTIKTALRLTPVWLVSAVLHALLLITLALLTYSHTQLAPAIIIAGNHADPEVLLEHADDIEIGNPEIGMEEPSWDPDTLEANLLSSETTNLEIPNKLAVTPTPFDMNPMSMLSEQLNAAQKISVDGDLRQGGKGSGAQFYGIQAQGDRFVFIVDSSTSMRLKFAEAKRELEYAVRRLREDQLFYVIFFDRDAERLRLGKWNGKGTRYAMKSRSEPNLVPPTIENINALVYWMNTIQLDSDTNPHPAVLYALRKLDPDAIFLLSDGEFNDGGSTEAFLERENIIDHPTDGLVPKTIVHCVGFYSRQGEITLKRVAAANGGTYRFIEPPRGLFPIINPLFGGKGRLR